MPQPAAQTKPLTIGVTVSLGEDPDAPFAEVVGVGLRSCHLVCWAPQLFTAEYAARVKASAAAAGVEISSLWAGHSGRAAWNFTEGPTTIGVVPAATRAQRVDEYRKAADFAARIGAPSVTTHVGFVPENPCDAEYPGVVAALRSVAQACRERGLGFWYETGQETPVALLRAIEDVGLDNQGVNLDPANLILYGKGNPVDAVDVLGRWIKAMHAKDGRYPTDGKHLGHETAIGQGRVDFRALIAALKALGFDGRVTIEREISGPEQKKDILASIAFLKTIV